MSSLRWMSSVTESLRHTSSMSVPSATETGTSRTSRVTPVGGVSAAARTSRTQFIASWWPST
ncbi:hypothetical protein AMK13_14305 [Streptomyces sp. CB02056]|nr:hypothetical protein AMK13_14305 [Streptomyces sp. CB02056]